PGRRARWARTAWGSNCWSMTPPTVRPPPDTPRPRTGTRGTGYYSDHHTVGESPPPRRPAALRASSRRLSMVPVRTAVSDLSLTGFDTAVVIVVLAIALVALVFGFMFRKQVLATPTGTDSMREIGAAVQEGASAYLTRQFKTLGVFAVVAFLLLLV